MFGCFFTEKKGYISYNLRRQIVWEKLIAETPHTFLKHNDVRLANTKFLERLVKFRSTAAYKFLSGSEQLCVAREQDRDNLVMIGR